MRIYINTKNKLNDEELMQLIEFYKSTSVTICVPDESYINLNKNLYLQNYKYKTTPKKIKGYLLGHSDYNESNKVINYKIQKINKEKSKILVCLGENKKSIFSKMQLKKQIKTIFNNINNYKNITIVYEPVWAIGGDKDIDVDYIIKNAIYINKIMNSIGANNIDMLYGGSVNYKIIKILLKTEIFNGFLISSYLLETKNYCQISDLIN